MATLKTLYAPGATAGKGLEMTLGVDYVINYRFSTADRAQAEAQFVKLIKALTDVGLDTEVRNGDHCALLIFVKVASTRLLNEVYRFRVLDWLYGVRLKAPEKQIQKSFEDEPVTDAERLRLVYLLITKPRNEGGAGITPKQGEWTGVESIFALHDHPFNISWIRQWSTKYLLNIDDLTTIKNRFGEKIGFYFAFMQAYFVFLIFPAVFGFSCWLLLREYSALYATVNCLFCVVFVEYLRKKEVDLAIQWNVRGASKIKHKRPQFRYDAIIKDPITGEEIKLYSPFKRLARQLLQIPFAVAAAVLLGGLIAVCFAIEIFISEIYNGPFKAYLVFIPTVLLTTIMPTLSALLTVAATWLTDLENYETIDVYEAEIVKKILVLNVITSYLPIFLTAFVYVPFATILVPYLDVFQLVMKPFVKDEKQMTTQDAVFQIDPDRLTKQVIYFTVTAQVVNFALEVVMPYIKRKVFRTVRASRRGSGLENRDANESPEEAAFLTRVRNEAELGVYDVASDFREMVVQFGYLSLFSVVWPLTAVSFLINNWIELRSDALKIAIEFQRPVPWRADSIGPWLGALGFLTWLGSLTSAALVFLFRGDGLGPGGGPWNISAWGLLLTMLFSEQVYFITQIVVRYALGKIDSPGLQKERAERFAIRRQYLEEALGQEAAKQALHGGILAGEKFDKQQTDEDEAEKSSHRDHSASLESFWLRQPSEEEKIRIGRQIIANAIATETKKTK